MATQDEYDAGEVTDRERLAAQRQKAIAEYNADATKNQLGRQIANYDFANRQNRRLADVQLKQNRRKAEADRFEAQRNLQNAALGLFGSMNQAMNGSAVGNTMRMLEDRNDAENNTYWTQHQVNQDAVENAYTESANQNQVAKLDAVSDAQKALADIQADTAANLNNINPNLYEEPQSADELEDWAAGFNRTNRVNENNAQLSGYLMPEYSGASAASQNRRTDNQRYGNGFDYYSRLIRQLNKGRLV